jgi:hypothetical protein
MRPPRAVAGVLSLLKNVQILLDAPAGMHGVGLRAALPVGSRFKHVSSWGCISRIAPRRKLPRVQGYQGRRRRPGTRRRRRPPASDEAVGDNHQDGCARSDRAVCAFPEQVLRFGGDRQGHVFSDEGGRRAANKVGRRDKTNKCSAQPLSILLYGEKRPGHDRSSCKQSVHRHNSKRQP